MRTGKSTGMPFDSAQDKPVPPGFFTDSKPQGWTTRRDLASRRWRSGQEPAEKSAEDQAKPQCLPEMAAGHAGGHQGVRQQQYGCPGRQKERSGNGRFPPGDAEHADQREDKRNIEQRAKRREQKNPAGVQPSPLQRSEEAGPFGAGVVPAHFGVLPRDIVAKEHIKEHEGDNEQRKSPSDGSSADARRREKLRRGR